MADVLGAMGGVATIFILMAVGVVLARMGWITEPVENFIMKFALKISVPCVLFSNCLKYLGEGLRQSNVLHFLLPPVSILLCLLLAMGVARLISVPREQRGVFYVIFSMSNTIFIGLPVCQAIFGESNTPFVILYYIGNTVMFWTIGVSLIARDGGQPFKFNLASIKRIFSPALMGFLIGLAVVLLGVELPKVLSDAINSLGGMNTALVMLLLGSTIHKMGFKQIFKLDKTGAVALTGRMIISPLIVLGLCAALGWGYIPSGVYVAQAGMPTMNQLMLLAQYYNADQKLTAKMLPATCILMMVTMPVWIGICRLIFGQ